MTRDDGKRLAAGLRRLPRVAFWIAGSILACAGALGARFLSEAFALEDRIPIWLAGSVVVFLGLCVLSYGTRARLEPIGGEDEEEPDEMAVDVSANAAAEPQPAKAPPVPEAAGAGEGNRTLA